MMVLRALQRTAPSTRKSLETHPLPRQVRDERRIDGSLRRDASETRGERDADDAEPLGRGAVFPTAHCGPSRSTRPISSGSIPVTRARVAQVPHPVDGRQGRARPGAHGALTLFAFLTYSALAGAWFPIPRVRAQLPALWTDNVWFWSLAHCVTFNLPVPVRVLCETGARICAGSLAGLRANAPLSTTA